MSVALRKPRLARMQALPIFVRYRLTIGSRVCDRQRDRVNHDFEQTRYRGKLWRGKPVDQLIHVLARIAHPLSLSSHTPMLTLI